MLLRNQFVVGMKASPVRRAYLSFNNSAVDAVLQEQEDTEATVTVTKTHEPP